MGVFGKVAAPNLGIPHSASSTRLEVRSAIEAPVVLVAVSFMRIVSILNGAVNLLWFPRHWVVSVDSMMVRRVVVWLWSGISEVVRNGSASIALEDFGKL